MTHLLSNSLLTASVITNQTRAARREKTSKHLCYFTKKWINNSNTIKTSAALSNSDFVFVPCAGSSVWEEGCLESSSWLWAAARWSTAAPRPPSLWPWYPVTRYQPGHSKKRQSTSRRASLDIQMTKNRKIQRANKVWASPLVHKAAWIWALVPSSTEFQPETSFFALP